MPGYKRWFPVSQHINRDPELWDLCRQFGDRSIRIWLEILSIADRHGGVIPGASTELSPDLRRALADASRTSGQTVANCWRRLIELSWVTPSEPARISNYLDYHRSRKTNSATADANVSAHLPSEPSEPSEPNLIKNAAKLDSPKPKLDHKIKEVADRIYNSDPQKFARLVVWIKSVQKQSFKNEHIALALESFESYAKDISDWYPYLSKVVNLVRNQSNGSGAGWDAQKFKNDEKAWLRDFLRNGMK